MSDPRPAIAPEVLRTRITGAFDPADPAREAIDDLPQPTIELLARYCELVQEWNARTNLTGARSWEAFAEQHVADVVPALPHLPAGPFRFVDVGSGAGLPGLVLAILRPDTQGELLEPIGKKHAFLALAIRTLALPVRAHHRRLEDHLAFATAGSADLAVSRATWPADEWLQRARPLVAPGGRILAFTGADPPELPQAARTIPYTLAARPRHLIVLEP